MDITIVNKMLVKLIFFKGLDDDVHIKAKCQIRSTKKIKEKNNVRLERKEDEYILKVSKS